MVDIIMQEMTRYNAEGVDFVDIFERTPLGEPKVLYSYTREEWLATDRCYPKTGRRYWIIKDGQKIYVI